MPRSLLFAFVTLLAACGGSVDGATPAPAPPTAHRSVAVACPAAGGTTSRCKVDDDCRGIFHGHCEAGTCNFDQCTTDAGCGAKGVCFCKGATPVGRESSLGNVCVVGNCQTDADCPSGFCSPSYGSCGDYSGVQGYYCHTASDACRNDSECPASGWCGYDTTAGKYVLHEGDMHRVTLGARNDQRPQW